MSSFEGKTKAFFIAKDQDRASGLPGELVAIYHDDWGSDRPVVEGWRGPKIESEDFARRRLKPYDCQNLVIDIGGYWDCLRGYVLGAANKSEWTFHATTADRIEEIARDGLKPSNKSRWPGEFGKWSIGKVFFTEDLNVVKWFANQEMLRDLERKAPVQTPVLLRVRKDRISDSKPDADRILNSYVERIVPPEDLEAWIPWERAWKPVPAAAQAFNGVTVNISTDRRSWGQRDRYLSEEWPRPDEFY